MYENGPKWQCPTCLLTLASINTPKPKMLFFTEPRMAEDLEENWWDKDQAKEEITEVIETETKAKKKNRKRKKISEVDTTLMSSEDEVIHALQDIVGNVAREELAQWIQKASIRMV